MPEATDEKPIEAPKMLLVPQSTTRARRVAAGDGEGEVAAKTARVIRPCSKEALKI